MANLNIALHRCVRAVSKFSNCDKCETSCPVDAISIEATSTPLVDNLKCVECGACLSACPTEAVTLKDFSPLEFSFNLIENGDSLIDCKVNVPCLASISHEYLVSIAILKQGNITLNFGHCAECEIFSKVGEQIDNQIGEANLLLEALNRKERVVLESLDSNLEISERVETERRKIFDISQFRRDNSIFDRETVKQIREDRGVPNRRKLLLMALQRVEDSRHILASEDLSTLSQKRVDESCTNCQICYRICPSKALSSDYKNSVINFEPHLCLKCHLCHDVCEPSSIEIKESFSISKLIERGKDKLIEFNIAKCHECDAYFTKVGDSNLCRRCEIEESEAIELWRD